VGRGTLPVVARSTVVDLADADLAMVQDLARRRWPHGRHPGGLAWEVTTDGLADVAVAWIEGDAVVGWSAVGQPEGLIVEVAPGRIDVAKTALVAYPAPAGAYAKAGFVGTLICHLNEAGRCSPDQAICPRGCA
jgi:hypothetical protein